MEAHRLALTPGYQIEHFRIEATLGKGGFGITYVAVDLQLGKRVAIKELLPDSIATRIEGSTVVPHSASMQENWEWARERFLDEARTLAGFSHPAIVGVHRLLEANGTVYMVMDYVEGETYETRLQRVGRETDQASLMAVISPILDGLSEVHAKGLLHRDIKPENILISRRGQPVLIDFGSARSSIGATMTMTSIVTHGYSPIEQYQTKGKMGPWTDIYAIGAVMCRAITGERPPVAADRLMDDQFHWLSHRNLNAFPKRYLQNVDWALRIKPDDRPANVADWRTHFSSPSAKKEGSSAPTQKGSSQNAELQVKIACPRCQQRIRMPESMLSTQIQCPTCSYVFVPNGQSTGTSASTQSPPAKEAVEPLAQWSLWLSISAFILCSFGGFLLGLPAVITGHYAIKKINQNPMIKGRGMAITGLVLGYCCLALTVMGIFIALSE
jgi:serine/threonine protein kinase